MKRTVVKCKFCSHSPPCSNPCPVVYLQRKFGLHITPGAGVSGALTPSVSFFQGKSCGRPSMHLSGGPGGHEPHCPQQVSSMNHPLHGCFLTPLSLSGILTPAPWNLLPCKLPATNTLSQNLLSGEPKLREFSPCRTVLGINSSSERLAKSLVYTAPIPAHWPACSSRWDASPSPSLAKTSLTLEQPSLTSLTG